MQKLLLTLASLAIIVITFMVATTAFTASAYDREFKALGDLLGMIAIVVGLLVWFPVNLALWRVSGRPPWLLAILRVQAVPTVVLTLLVAAILLRM